MLWKEPPLHTQRRGVHFDSGKSLHYTLRAEGSILTQGRVSITHSEKRGPFGLGKELPLFFEKSHSFTLRGSYSLILILEGGCRVPVETVLPRLLMPHPTLNRNSMLHLLVPLPLLRIRVAWSRAKHMVGN